MHTHMILLSTYFFTSFSDGSTVITINTGTVGSPDSENEQTEKFKQAIYRYVFNTCVSLARCP